ncbi:MAG: alanine racemase, partial [Porticoccus sp.]|nr:alanine racemase [Porticoccus sp.]
SKSGLSVQECSEVSTAVTALPRLNLRGLMTIPQHNATEVEQRKTFKAMSKLLLRVRDSSPQLTTLDTLSMGMSSDLEAALQEGATIIRVGSAIFGPR